MLKVNFDLNSSERSIGSRVSVLGSGLGDGWELADVNWATEESPQEHKVRVRRIERIQARETIVKVAPSRRDRMFIECGLDILSQLRRSEMHGARVLLVNSISLLRSCVRSLI